MGEFAHIRGEVQRLLDRANKEFGTLDRDRLRENIKRARTKPPRPPIAHEVSHPAARVGEQLLGYLGEADEACAPAEVAELEAMIQEGLPNV